MIIGQYSAKAESNGRVMLPKKIRQFLKTKKLIVTRGYDGCLLLINTGQFQQVIKDIVSQSFLNPDKRNTERFLLGSAFELEIDNHGRLIIPDTLKKYAGLKHQLIFVGLGNRIEIWAQEAWQKQQKYLTSKAQDIAQRLLNS
ncbi:MAG: division/cell wall cluster transcriptional repressor MraZ [bacterium]|nr:division/cell wall cluster transcriptional repressor MraZ [bacterium]